MILAYHQLKLNGSIIQRSQTVEYRSSHPVRLPVDRDDRVI